MSKHLIPVVWWAVLATLVAGCNEQAGKKPAATAAVAFDVYKSPSCGCCGEWVSHLEQAGLAVNVHHPDDLLAIKDANNIAPALQSCHTMVSHHGYAFEGHIPAKWIQRFLQQPPEGAVGLAVPGMPVGSPGMEVGERFTPYPILLLKADGSTEVYAEINQIEDQY